MNPELCELISTKLEQYQRKNIVNGLQTEESRELTRQFLLYSLNNVIESLEDIPRKYDPIFQ